MRARMIELSWSGLRVPAIAVELDCSQKTVRCWLHRFNRSGLQGLDDLGGQGRKRRIAEEQRSRIISLVKTVPPGRLRWEPVGELWAFDESGPAEWTPDSLAAAARAEGIEVGRSQVRRILLAEGVRWCRTRYPAIVRLWESSWPEFTPFLQFDAEIRRIVCTTNSIESVNARIRKAVRARGHFPTEQAALKCVYMAVMSLDPTGAGRKRWTMRWKGAMNAFDLAFDGRLTARQL